MNRIVKYSTVFCLLLIAISCAAPRAGGDKKKSPQIGRVVVFDGSNLSREIKDGKDRDVSFEGWATARYYFEKEKAPYSGDLMLPNFQSTNDVAEAIFTFKNGRQDGEAILLFPGGKPKSEGVFKDGTIESAKGWHENGQKKFVAKFEKGKLVGLQLWIETGEKKGQSLALDPDSLGKRPDGPPPLPDEAKLPKRIPSYIQDLFAGPALAKAGLSAYEDAHVKAKETYEALEYCQKALAKAKTEHAAAVKAMTTVNAEVDKAKAAAKTDDLKKIPEELLNKWLLARNMAFIKEVLLTKAQEKVAAFSGPPPPASPGPPDLGGLTLDNWLKFRANIDQRARYQFVFGNVKDLYIKQKRYNQKQASLAAYNLIRSSQYAYPYILFVYYGKDALDGENQGPEKKEPEEMVFTGSGFFISRDGYFITNYHVIEDTKKVSVRRGQTTYKAKVVRVDKRLDLALLKVEIFGRFVPIPITRSASSFLGDKVYTIGFPMSGIQGLLPKYTEGTISSLAGIRDESTRFQVSVPVQPGNSGGALIDENGHIVGVIVSGLSTKYFLKKTGVAPQVVNYAIKSSSLLGFLEGTNVRYIGVTGGNSLKGKASIKRTQEGIGQVIAR